MDRSCSSVGTGGPAPAQSRSTAARTESTCYSPTRAGILFYGCWCRTIPRLQEEEMERTPRFAVAAALSPSFTDSSVSVKCKPVSGHVDRACGLVFRYGDENNYYLTRANALEDNVRFYYVKNGRRIQLANWSGKVTSSVWHELRVDFQGDHVEAYWDGTKRIDAHNRTFSGPGRVGVWTKADSYTC